ncbi:MAG: SufE family protein [Oscillospiraceae bacterium]|nr:SufE family protein [Oscillospiraceae bacterium]
MDEKLTIAEAENTYIDDLNTLGDWFLEYEYLLAISADLPHIPKQERTAERRVKGCQTGVWLLLRYEDGRVRIAADSDALIIRGIISIAVFLLDGRTPQEICAYTPRYVEQTDIKAQISTDRFHGIQSVIEEIKRFAAQQLEGGAQ